MERNITRERMNRYFINVGRVASDYNLLVFDVFDLVDYQDSKRIKRGEEGNLEKSLDVVERALRIKRR